MTHMIEHTWLQTVMKNSYVPKLQWFKILLT